MKFRIIVTFIMSLTLLSNSAFPKLKKIERNSFTYKNSSDSYEEKKVDLIGVTNFENLAPYCEEAVLENRKITKLDREIDINIKSIKVVKLFLNNSEYYNGIISYIIRTTDERILFHFPYILAHRVRKIESKNLDKIRTLAQAFGMQAMSEGLLNSSISGDMNAFANYAFVVSKLSSASQTVIHHIWTTVELYSQFVSRDTLQIPGKLSFTYKLIENSDFEQ